ITAGYGGSSLHATSSDSTGSKVTATKRSTSTNVSCSPGTVAVNQGSTCTATVADTDAGNKSAPTGQITLAHTGSGSFDSNTCTLANPTPTSASCSLTSSPTPPSSDLITAGYGGSSLHAASSDSTGSKVTATKRSTSTNVSCSP